MRVQSEPDVGRPAEDPGMMNHGLCCAGNREEVGVISEGPTDFREPHVRTAVQRVLFPAKRGSGRFRASGLRRGCYYQRVRLGCPYFSLAAKYMLVPSARRAAIAYAA